MNQFNHQQARQTTMIQDTLSIKDWAVSKDKESREDMDCYIKDGISKEKAFDIIMSGSTLGAGYKAQIRYDYGINPFNQ